MGSSQRHLIAMRWASELKIQGRYTKTSFRCKSVKVFKVYNLSLFSKNRHSPTHQSVNPTKAPPNRLVEKSSDTRFIPINNDKQHTSLTSYSLYLLSAKAHLLRILCTYYLGLYRISSWSDNQPFFTTWHKPVPARKKANAEDISPDNFRSLIVAKYKLVGMQMWRHCSGSVNLSKVCEG